MKNPEGSIHKKKTETFICNKVEDLTEVAHKLIATFSETKVVAFFGDLGSGKTTLIKVICKHLGILDNVSSPSYAILNEYRNAEGLSVFHFDFYRIKSESEAFDIGFEEYLYSGDICLIEWPGKIENLLPAEYTMVAIKFQNGNRLFTIEY